MQSFRTIREPFFKFNCFLNWSEITRRRQKTPKFSSLKSIYKPMRKFSQPDSIFKKNNPTSSLRVPSLKNTRQQSPNIYKVISVIETAPKSGPVPHPLQHQIFAPPPHIFTPTQPHQKSFIVNRNL